MQSITPNTLPKLTDIGLIYLWSSWPLGESFADVFDLYDLDDRQSKLWEGFPSSGAGLAKEALESTTESILVMETWYKKSFSSDRPFSERSKIHFELSQLKTQAGLLNSFIGGHRDN